MPFAFGFGTNIYLELYALNCLMPLYQHINLSMFGFKNIH